MNTLLDIMTRHGEKDSKTLNGGSFAFSLPFDISNSPTQNRGLQIIE